MIALTTQKLEQPQIAFIVYDKSTQDALWYKLNILKMFYFSLISFFFCAEQ